MTKKQRRDKQSSAESHGKKIKPTCPVTDVFFAMLMAAS
jgi:hypothetical protein